MHQLMLIFTLVVFAFVAGTAPADYDCTPGYYVGRHCCEGTDFHYPYRESDSARECTNRYYRNSTESSSNTNPMACAMECIFFAEGLLTDDTTLNRTALKAFFTLSYPDFKPLMIDIIDKCFLSYQTNIDSSSSLECKSEAFQFQLCFSREWFLNCPATLWSASSQCDEIKAHVTKCPKVGVM